MTDPEDLLKFMVSLIVVTAIASSFLTGPLLESEGAESDVEMVAGSGQIETSPLQQIDEVSSVKSTLGDQIRLSGADDSQTELQSNIEVSDEWSVCTFATADSELVSKNESRTIVSMSVNDDEDVVLYYNGTSDAYEAWYYNVSSRNSYEANISAPSPSQRTLVCALRSGDQLEVARGNTTGDATPTTGTNTAPSPPSSNWDGYLEETRVYPSRLNNSQRAEWTDSPVLAVSGAFPEVRVTYDVRSRSVSSVPAYFSSGEMGLSNASLVDGATGPDLEEGVDYQVDGDEIVALDGHLSGNGDVVYAAYAFDSGPVYLIQLGVALFLFGILARKVLEVLETV